MNARLTGLGVTRFGRSPLSLVELMAEAGDQALEGVGRRTIDFLVIGNMMASGLQSIENLLPRVADRLGLDTAAGVRVDAASASGAAAFHVGAAEVASGAHDRVLVVAGEKMTDRPTTMVTEVLARSLDPAEARAGATMPALASLVAQRYLSRFDVAEARLHDVAVAAHQHAARNPNAQFRQPVSAEEVATSRPIALPLRLLHCASISDGAAAVVVERGKGDVHVLGIGQGLDALSTVDRPEFTSFRATRTAAQRAYEMARLTRKEVKFAEVHDAFAPFALLDLEDLGICGPGEAPDWFAQGHTSPDGRFPVNPSGGLLGRGHPVGASGLAQVAEVARPLNGEAGGMAIADRPSIGLAQSIGGLGTHNFVTILGRVGGGP